MQNRIDGSKNEMKNSVCLRSTNPRNFYLLIELMKEKKIPYYVPKNTMDECENFSILIVDGRYEEIKKANKKTIITIPLNADLDLLTRILEKIKLYTLGIETSNRLVIGIDIGEKDYGVAVVIDCLLVHSEITDKSGLIPLLDIFMSLSFKEKIIKIGVTSSNYDQAIKLAEELQLRYKVAIGLVDEKKSNKHDLKFRKRKLKIDENAAYNISMRDPFFILNIE